MAEAAAEDDAAAPPLPPPPPLLLLLLPGHAELAHHEHRYPVERLAEVGGTLGGLPYHLPGSGWIVLLHGLLQGGEVLRIETLEEAGTYQIPAIGN